MTRLDAEDSNEQTDALLWLAAAIIVGLGVTWLVLSKPWSDGGTAPQAYAPVSASPVSSAVSAAEKDAAARRQPVRTNLETPLEDNPLRMAELAYEAGMLVEPEEYSAWALYQQALQRDPDSDAARKALEEISEELLRRAYVALEQGRFADARATLERIRAAIPAHPGANDLAFRIDELTPRPMPAEEQVRAGAQEPERETAESVQAARPAQTRPQVDPMLAPHRSFLTALAENRLLTPEGSSAKHFLNELVELDADHELTQQARSRFFDHLLDRANAAIEDLDAAAAETWLDEAAHLALSTETVTAARAELRARLLAAETTRRVPSSALDLETYVAPDYPSRAVERAIEGWVDIEFTVAVDGATREIEVTDASHNSYFRREAVHAVEKWRFVPRVFLGQTIEQRAYTRIRFEFE